MTEYQKQILDPRWQMLRLLVLKRDNATCLICKSNKDSLHIHHEKYFKMPWDAPIETLKTLCFRCHEVVELCKKSKIVYKNINRYQRTNEKFIYVINTKVDTFGKSGKFAYILHNLNKNTDSFILLNFCFDYEFVEYILATF